MTKKAPGKDRAATGDSREERLKAALKENLRRRKAQAKARKGAAAEDGQKA